jgi:NADPH-dependent ferric siderophore reductase
MYVAQGSRSVEDWGQHNQAGIRDHLEMHYVLEVHDGGPMSDWAMTAKAGDVRQLAGPRSGFKRVTPHSWLLMAADETGLPAVAAILRQLPADQEVHVFAEVANETERQFLKPNPTCGCAGSTATVPPPRSQKH